MGVFSDALISFFVVKKEGGINDER